MTTARKNPPPGAHPWPVREPGAIIDAIADVAGVKPERVRLILNEGATWEPGEPHLEWVMVQDLAAAAAAWESRHPDGAERVNDLFEILLDHLGERLRDRGAANPYSNMMQPEGRELLPLAVKEAAAMCSEFDFAFPVGEREVLTLAALGPVLWVHDWPALAGDSNHDRATKAAEMLRLRGVFAIASRSDAEWTFLLKGAQKGGNVVRLQAIDGGATKAPNGVPLGSFLVAEARHLIADLAAEGRPLRANQAWLLLELADAVHDGHGQWFGSWEGLADKVAETYRAVTKWRDELAAVKVSRDGKTWPLIENVGWVKENQSKLDTWQLFPWLFPETKRGKKKRPGSQRRPQRGDGGRFTR